MVQSNPLIDRHRAALQSLCREYGVTRLELFGSATTAAFDPDRSDLDFIVEFPPDYDYGPWLTRFFEFQEHLASLFRRSIDLIMAGAIRKPRFIQSVNETRQLLYAA
jgi:predicted nucleotidyltransferase